MMERHAVQPDGMLIEPARASERGGRAQQPGQAEWDGTAFGTPVVPLVHSTSTASVALVSVGRCRAPRVIVGHSPVRLTKGRPAAEAAASAPAEGPSITTHEARRRASDWAMSALGLRGARARFGDRHSDTWKGKIGGWGE